MRFLKSICEGVVQASGERILGGAPWVNHAKSHKARGARHDQHNTRGELKITN